MKKLVLLSLLSLMVSCAEPIKKEGTSIVCTTGMLADAVQNLLLGVDSIELTALMGPGTDPHLYKANQGDVLALSRADLIIYNGLHLEGKMNEIFAKLPDPKVYAAADQLPKKALINASDYASAYDPHVWFDLNLWQGVVQSLSQRLIKLLPEHRSAISLNTNNYQDRLKRLHSWAKNRVKEIPENQRVLITAHDAFKYFGKAYGLEVRGLQGISTTAEYGIGDISALADFIAGRKIKAVFVENSVDPRAIEAVMEAVQSRGSDLHLGGELYSDAMGAPNSEAGTFLGMFHTNVETIHKALK